MKTLFAPFPQRLNENTLYVCFRCTGGNTSYWPRLYSQLLLLSYHNVKVVFPVTFALHQCLSVHAIGRRQSYEYHMTSVTYLNYFTHWLLSDSDHALNQWPRSKQWYAVNPTTTTHTESILGKHINNVRTQLL